MNVGLSMVECILSGGCANVASLEPVAFESSVYYCGQHVMANIKLSSMVKEGLLYVLLHNEGLRGAVVMNSTSLQN